MRYAWFDGDEGHTGKRVRFWTRALFPSGELFEPGKPVDLRVSPEDGSLAVIEPGGSAVIFSVVLAFGAFLVFIGLAGIIRLTMMIDGLKPAWREASSNLGGTTWTYWRRVGLPVLAPSMLGGFLLLFANAFSAFATAYALNTGSNLVPVKISFFLQGDVSGRSPMPFALATWMIIIMAASMGGYLLLRKRAERWRS